MMKCSVCGNPNLMKAGGAWSGRKRYQAFKCGKCGKTQIDYSQPYATKIERLAWEGTPDKH